MMQRLLDQRVGVADCTSAGRRCTETDGGSAIVRRGAFFSRRGLRKIAGCLLSCFVERKIP
jgi:hypothetical protein